MKVALLASNDMSLLNFRGELMRLLVAQGHEVIGLAPRKSPVIRERLAAVGVQYVETPLDSQGLNPWRDWRYRRSLETLLRRLAPDVLLAYTIKPVVHGCPAARRAGVGRVYALITGLGAAFHTGGLKGRVLAWVAARLYRTAFRSCDRVLVQNADIARFFLERRIVRTRERMAVVNGSGVDTVHFAAEPMGEHPPRFLFVGRLLWDKGIREFSAAARIVKQKCPEAEFWVVGDTDRNPAAISPEELRQLTESGVIRHFGFVEDVRPFLRDCSAFVLPSYHEGMPRAVLEAMATARPVVTTDAIGCRETIFDVSPEPIGPNATRVGRNGLLVPVQSSAAIAEAMLYLIEHRAAATAMGRAGRALAENHFEVRKINRHMLEEMGVPALPVMAATNP